MPETEGDHPDMLRQRHMALANWENEGGAGPRRGPRTAQSLATRHSAPPLKNAELVQLQVRMIALENLVIALLANASDSQLALAQEMSAYISPRPGFTRHGLTIHAAAHISHLVERSGHFRLRELPPTHSESPGHSLQCADPRR